MNRTMKTFVAVMAVGFIGCSIVCERAQALPSITGSIGFTGPASASGASPGSPINITFTNPWQVAGFPAPTGTYAGIPGTTLANFANFSFTGDGAGASLVASTMPEWSFSFNGINYSFDLLTLTTGHTESSGGVGSMAFTGTGTVHADGFEDTPASWGLHGSGQGFNFELSGSTTAAIPEGGVLSLLGLGFALLAGKGLFGKRKSI
jgi:hypothetical protein